MAREKSISVRFAAVGGEKLKAEMRDIGAAGKSAMASVVSGSGAGSDSLEQFGLAAAHARAQLEAIEAKSRAAAAALRTTSQATTAMQNRVNAAAGVSSPSGLSSAEMLQQGQMLDDLRAKFNPLYAAIRDYRQAVSEIRAAHVEGAISADEMAAAIGKVRSETNAAIDKIKGLTASQKEAARAAEELARAERDAAAAAARAAEAQSNLRAKYNPAFGLIRDYRRELTELRDAHKSGAISSAEFTAAGEKMRESFEHRRAVMRGEVEVFEQLSRSSRGGALRMQQLAFQGNDIAVSLAGGMHPGMVLMQQGTQIAQIYGFGNGGVGQIFKDIGSMLMALPGPAKAAGIALALGAGAVVGMQHEINKTSSVVVSFGDVTKAVFQVLGDRIHNILKPAIDAIAPWFSAAWDLVVDGVKWVGNFLINGVTAAVVGIGNAVAAIPLYFKSAFLNAKAHVQHALAGILSVVHDMLQGIANGFNSVLGTSLKAPQGLLGTSTTLIHDGTNNELAALDAMREIETRRAETDAQISEIMNRDPMGDFFGDVSARAQQNALDRDKDKKKGGRKGGSRKAEKDEVADLIEQLQRELAVLRETDPIKKKMLEYSKQMEGATAAERAQIQSLIETLDGAKNGWEAVGRSLAEYAEESKRVGDDMGDAFVDAFGSAEDAFAEFVKTGKLDFTDLINSMIADFARLTAQEFITGPLAGMVGSWLAGVGSGDPLNDALGAAGAPVRSFDGGGHTGYGPRSGGLDGKGGFMALVHPRERIFDETKGSGAGGGRVHVTVGIDPKNGNITAFVDERAASVTQSGLEAYDQQVLPRSVKRHMRDPRAVG
ncbi:phage tail tape measure C-terminal domain-containing protein [Paracoccus litorisediminis]|uniref:Phage tail tape measure protein, lambda family n=1 Tax=Paracoccus litorisediminis TaxID=2006130 RepID=A0A844HX81_9RHOB|nr:phage tail tape measure C-terminal domain-containing protein [Paracoccus litorisediminis]MTH62111.1 hypothetical protein [Paracoccus litorisediminis]